MSARLDDADAELESLEATSAFLDRRSRRLLRRRHLSKAELVELSELRGRAAGLGREVERRWPDAADL